MLKNELKEKAELLIKEFEMVLSKSSLPGPFKSALTKPELALLTTFIMWYLNHSAVQPKE